ncbi:MAG: hypothetical protein AVDCRST_MAG56-2121, partial [uncultured Cytophagales bacterium]
GVSGGCNPTHSFRTSLTGASTTPIRCPKPASTGFWPGRTPRSPCTTGPVPSSRRPPAPTCSAAWSGPATGRKSSCSPSSTS